METPDESPTAASTDYVFQFAAANSGKLESLPIYFAARTSGLFRSDDAGQSWKSAYTTLGTREPLPTTSVVLAPDFEHEPAVFAGLNGAVLCSYDGGTTWQRGRLPTPLPAVSALAISVDYAADGTVFAGTNEDGVLISRDRGRTWASWNFGLLDLHVLCLAVSPDFAKDETILAGTESGLFRSTNGGRAWKEVSLPMPFDAVLCLGASSGFSHDETLFAGTENNGLMISRDRGKTWDLLAEVTRETPVNQVMLLPRPPYREVVILLGGALWRSRDCGRTWKRWKAKRQGDYQITAVLALIAPRAGTLVGFEDGSIAFL